MAKSDRSGALLHGEGLSYAAGGRSLVADATLQLTAGRVTALVGPNGAGKSTLLKLLTGEISPCRGHVRLEGQDIAAIPPWQLAARRAVMAQQTRLAFPFSVYEVARLGVDGVGRGLSRAGQDAIVTESLASAGVLALAGRSYQTLSGGEQQRVQFARALCQLAAGRSLMTPQLLFLDEPVASLDLCHQIGLLDRAREVAASGVAVLVVLHDLNLAVTYADELVVMDRGRIVALGPADTVLDDALLQRVFRVDLAFGRSPAPGVPFLLPQQRMSC